MDDDEWPRAETDCACRVGSPDCPCEADGEDDGLCSCCREEEHSGSCVAVSGG